MFCVIPIYKDRFSIDFAFVFLKKQKLIYGVLKKMSKSHTLNLHTKHWLRAFNTFFVHYCIVILVLHKVKQRSFLVGNKLNNYFLAN